MAAARTLEVAGHEVTVTHPDKVVFPRARPHQARPGRGTTSAVAEGALRGVAAGRWCSSGSSRASRGGVLPEAGAREAARLYVDVVELKYASGTSAKESVVHDAAGLAWAVNLGCVDLNPHPVLADDLAHPDELRIDLDPVPGTPWEQIVDVALVARDVLEEHGLAAWPKTSGGRGFHVYARIHRNWPFKQVRLAAETVAREVERRAPDIATSRWWKEERHGVFVDFNQNAYDRTVASAYSVRPTPDARVSTPLAWDEVEGCRPEEFTVAAVPGAVPRERRPVGRHGRRGRVARRAARAGRPARPGREAAEGHRAPDDDDAARRDRPREERGGGAGRARALEGAPPGRRRPPRARRRPGRPDARQQLALVPDPGQPAARARGAAARAGAARGRLRPLGRAAVAGGRATEPEDGCQTQPVDERTPDARGRALWPLFETVHAVTYFAPQSHPRRPPNWASRASGPGTSCCGPRRSGGSHPALVTAAFHGFAGRRIEKVLPGAWDGRDAGAGGRGAGPGGRGGPARAYHRMRTPQRRRRTPSGTPRASWTSPAGCSRRPMPRWPAARTPTSGSGRRRPRCGSTGATGTSPPSSPRTSRPSSRTCSRSSRASRRRSRCGSGAPGTTSAGRRACAGCASAAGPTSRRTHGRRSRGPRRGRAAHGCRRRRTVASDRPGADRPGRRAAAPVADAVVASGWVPFPNPVGLPWPPPAVA